MGQKDQHRSGGETRLSSAFGSGGRHAVGTAKLLHRQGLSECFWVDQDAQGANHDGDIAPKRPTVEIFQICTKPADQIAFGVCRAAKTPDLGQTRQARLQSMTYPVLVINLPEQLGPGL